MNTEPTSSESRPAKGFTTTRLVLIVAALLAAGAVGVKLWQDRSGSVKMAGADAAQGEQPDVQTMIASLEKRLKDNPEDANGWRMLGWSLYGTGKYAEAAQAYRKATQLAPDNVEGWSALGEALVLASADKVTPDASAAFAKALAIDPKDPRARYFTAMAFAQAGNNESAIGGLASLLKDTPKGAPWEDNVRQMIKALGEKSGLDVSQELAINAAAPAATGGAALATAGIPGPNQQQMRAAASMPKGQQDAMIEGMVNGLEAKLKANPKNLSGWIMLMRSRTQLGETAKAAKALADARAAFAGDSAALAQLSEAAGALGMQ